MPTIFEGEGWPQLLKKISQKTIEFRRKVESSNLADSVAKAVLRTQPPHAQDVPAMVDWFVKFGGGETCFFVDHLLEFCRVKSVLGHPHIPGRVFASLAALSFDTQLPGHAICAVLKRTAMSKKVADGIAQDIQASQISQFGGKKLQNAFLEVDGILQQSWKLLFEKRVPEPQRTIEFGWLGMSLIDHLLGRPNLDGDTFKTMENVAEALLQRLFGEDDIEAAPASSAGKVASSSDAKAMLVEYSADTGEAQAVPKMVLLSKGYKVGSTYTTQENPDCIMQLTKIEDDGQCQLAALDDFGRQNDKPVKVSGAVLAQKYRPTKCEFKFKPSYADVHHSETLMNDRIEHMLQAAISTTAVSMKDYDLTIREKPCKGVFHKPLYEGETEKPPLDNVVLMPFGTCAVWDPTTSTSKKLEDRCTVKLTHPDGTTTMFVLSPGGLDPKKVQCAHWSLQPTSDEEKANMALEYIEVSFIMPSTSKLKIAGNQYVVSIPTFKSCKQIPQGAELLFFKPKPKKESIEKGSKPARPLKLDIKANKRVKTDA